MNILVVEDEFITSSTLARSLKKMGYSVSGQAMNANEAIDILENKQTDLAILDINIDGDKDGIWIADQIKEKYKIPFVFLTAYGDEATVERAMKTEPHGYLMKPFESVDIYTSIKTALTNFTSRVSSEEERESIVSKNEIFIKEDHLFTKVKFQDIAYIKSDGNYIEIYTASKRHVIRSTLKDFFDRLPESLFFRTQKSYVINIEKIESIGTNFVIVESERIPLSDKRKIDLIDLLEIKD